MKTNKNERGFWGVVEFGFAEMCFPSLGLGHKYKLKEIWRQHYCIILATYLENTYSHIFGRVATIHLIIEI